MSKKIKEMELAVLRKSFAGVKDYVLLEPVKVDAGTEYEFRKKLRAQKVSVKLVKNSFAKKILAENGVDAASHFAGPTLLCWGGDSVKGLANSVDTAVKESKKDPKAPDKFKVKTAIADGQQITLELAKKIPTRLEAIGGVVGAILGPGSMLAASILGPGASIAGILKTIETKTPEAAPAA